MPSLARIRLLRRSARIWLPHGWDGEPDGTRKTTRDDELGQSGCLRLGGYTRSASFYGSPGRFTSLDKFYVIFAFRCLKLEDVYYSTAVKADSTSKLTLRIESDAFEDQPPGVATPRCVFALPGRIARTGCTGSFQRPGAVR